MTLRADAAQIVVLACRSARAAEHGETWPHATLGQAAVDGGLGTTLCALHGLAGLFVGQLETTCETTGTDPDALFERLMDRLTEAFA